ncbi:FAD-binding oxidoreductase [Aldersonia sp. NBC_00410]|uniref:FAD-binding oxidoreductase n=1 Tax=Aldersonia sp. NBC_00410 TaxID=2975954 RepID=UPI00224DFFBE|nr:FAD-binding oxidoreductase [Aldersonia sp. NBC_00410]MCX5043584.1 FAD-binding oxidoreductase [Aldersonia sp. NBC_00410]
MTTLDEFTQPTAGQTIDPTLETLRSRVTGQVVTECDPGYDAARAGFNLHFDQRPAIIVVAATSQDVAEGVRFAADHGLRVTIRATGHGPGREPSGAVMINTSALTDVRIDREQRTATIGAGAKWGAVLGPAQQHGLAPLLGSTTDVGAVGYTLGGGMGWLARQYGLCSDSARTFELVTPDGTLLRTSATEHPEIFWALKGGGAGTLGVVTSMEIELYPVETVYAGNLFYPIENARAVMTRWRDWVRDADRGLTSSVAIMHFPPLEFIPEPFRGRSFVIVRGCWSGDPDAGAELIDGWRQWRAPAMDTWGPLPFAAADAISMDPTDPAPAMATTEWFDALPDEAIDTILATMIPEPGTPPLLLAAEIRHAGGAIAEYAPAAANDLGRSGEFLLALITMVPEPQLGLVIEAAMRDARATLEPYVNGAAYLNFLEGEERASRAVTAYSPDNLARLRRVKVALDPGNRFCHGFGII